MTTAASCCASTSRTTSPATAGSQRAARLADAEGNSADGPALAKLATDVATDREALLALMEAAGIEPNRLKTVIASVGEKLGALKLNGRLTDRSPLSTVVEIEAMQMAVRGKRSLWETLLVAMPTSTPIDIAGLVSPPTTSSRCSPTCTLGVRRPSSLLQPS